MRTYYAIPILLPTSYKFVPSVLKTNKSLAEFPVDKVGAVPPAHLNTAFHVIVLEPVPSCTTSSEQNAPANKLVGALNVLLPPNVTLATCCVCKFQSIFAPSVKVASAEYNCTGKENYVLELISLAVIVPSTIIAAVILLADGVTVWTAFPINTQYMVSVTAVALDSVKAVPFAVYA